MIIWHYAVQMPGYYLEPACTGDRKKIPGTLYYHGITKVRGDVTCPDCKRAMGIV